MTSRNKRALSALIGLTFMFGTLLFFALPVIVGAIQALRSDWWVLGTLCIGVLIFCCVGSDSVVPMGIRAAREEWREWRKGAR